MIPTEIDELRSNANHSFDELVVQLGVCVGERDRIAQECEKLVTECERLQRKLDAAGGETETQVRCGLENGGNRKIEKSKI